MLADVSVGVFISVMGLEPSILTGRDACIRRSLTAHVEEGWIYLGQENGLLARDLVAC